MEKLKLVIINGSMYGDSENSNTIVLLQLVEKEFFARGTEVIIVSPEFVEYEPDKNKSIPILNVERIIKQLETADGILVGTGTYWGQSSSVLQKFIEDITPTEGTDIWLGKPIGFIISEHSTGGQMVLSNLMLTFSNYGCLIPPQAGIIFSRTGQIAKETEADWAKDVWDFNDIGAICEKIVTYASVRKGIKLKSWPINNNPDSYNKRWVQVK